MVGSSYRIGMSALAGAVALFGITLGSSEVQAWGAGDSNHSGTIASTPRATTDVRRLSPAAPRGFDFRALERDVHDEMNRMRQDPSAYALKLEARRPSYRGLTRRAPDGTTILLQEGLPALDEAIAALRGAQRVPRLSWSEALRAAAHVQAEDLNRHNGTGHAGSDGSQPQDRVARFGTVDGWVAENIAFGPRTGEDIVIGLIVDDGVPDRGHREVLLKPQLFTSGTACGPHPAYGVVCVINYATRLNPHPGVDVAARSEATNQPYPNPVTPEADWGEDLSSTMDAMDDEEDQIDWIDEDPVFDVDAFGNPTPASPSGACPNAWGDTAETRAPPSRDSSSLRGSVGASGYDPDHPRNQPPALREIRRPMLPNRHGQSPQPQYGTNQPQYRQPQYRQPQPQYRQPQPQYRQPQPHYGQPQPQYRQPQPHYGQPQPQYRQPQPQYGQPQPQYRQPQPHHGQPQPQYGQPQGGGYSPYDDVY